jgi:glycosyltransferase involved in cell wall biosynthesis
MPPRITIVTPSLNQAAFLERTIRSVLEQGYPDLEYFVFDGGSTDGSIEILERYDDRIAYWESVPDRGQSHAINKGLERATGEIVAYLNSDDYYLPGALSAIAEAFERDPSVGWVCGACRYLHADGSLNMIWRPRLPEGPRPLWVRDMWYVPQASSFWRRSEVERIGGFREDLHYGMDTEFGIRLALAGVLPVLLDRELAVRAHHELAKSEDPSRWIPEYERIRVDLRAGGFAPHEHIAEFCFRVARRIRQNGRSISAFATRSISTPSRS